MSNKFLLSLLLFFFPLALSAQLLNPVQWDFSAVQTENEDGGDVQAYKVYAKAVIEEGWHVYALDAGDGPIPTSLVFDENDQVDFVGEVDQEGDKITEYDGVFDSDLSFFEKEMRLVQTVTVKKSTQLSGYVEFMVCDDQQCLPPKEVPFQVDLLDVAGSPIEGAALAAQEGEETVSAAPEGELLSSADDDARGRSLGWIFWAAFAGGLIALFTPCVFSVIPVTVSFFTKKSETRMQGIKNAILYSLSIIVIYTLLGFLITLIFGPSAMNQLASNIWANLTFFVVFLLFGLSFLGAFEISLPSSWSTQADSKAGLGTIGGIFFMALTLAIVSFSCTGPIIGNLLVLAAEGGKSGPLIGMLGFSVALAIPFALFAIFPSWLNSMGKAGGWLNSVKVVLGLLELALALKFLSNADMAYHWGILSKEVFLAIWIVLFALIGFYLLGKIKFSNDSDLKHVSVTRLLFAIASFSFTIYLIPGLFGVHLKGMVGGFLPAYSSFNHAGIGGASSGETAKAGTADYYDGIRPVKHVEIFSKATPDPYMAFYDYDEALQAAQKLNKPILLDFTGWSCVNCRKMEAEVWTDPEVRRIITQDFVLLQLYVDDRTKLPETDQYLSEFDNSKIKTIGQKNADYEIVRFNRNSQPYYVLLDGHGEMLNRKGYRFDAKPKNFITFMEEAKTEYKNRALASN